MATTADLEETIEPARAYSVKDISAHEFVVKYAAWLRKSGKLPVPKWVDIVKTGSHKELAPYGDDWYYVRAASLARKVYLRQGTGIGTFRRVYGSRKNNGTAPEHFNKGSGGLIRAILIGLEEMGVVETIPSAKGGGRRITSRGQKDLDLVASQIALPTRENF